MKIHANQAWNSGGRALLSLKTPTCLLLNDKKQLIAFGYDAENQYADIVMDEKQDEYFYFHRFKMNLHNNKCKKTGTGVKIQEIQWVLTIPAIWTDAAKQFMRECAEKASIPSEKLLLALEPETASIFCQYLPTEKLHGADQTFAMSAAGTRYMVADLGGGTADITVHEKTKYGRLKELHRASGNDCGGTSVDGRFFQMLVKILGGPVMKRLKMKIQLPTLIFFENLRLPDYIQSRVLRFTYGVEVIEVFNPTMHDVKYREEIDGEDKCDKIFSKFVSKNEAVEAGKRVSRAFYTSQKMQRYNLSSLCFHKRRSNVHR
ncbi:unnamed protein product [Mytilus edulis]|uniref:Heat shock 70 kDa protein 12A n=1 Tax=Mytilus edulis TaxID=6550 RepID=A0A8S3Q7Q4_MYTED|nr:unnamed protein product [Mytilus edulis]